MNEETRSGQKRNALLADLVQVATAHMEENEVPGAVAVTVAHSLADRLADYWGGQVIVFPRDFLWKLAKLELEIYDQFNGQNYDELARQHGMTVRGVRKLIGRVRVKLARQRPNNQGDLLDD